MDDGVKLSLMQLVRATQATVWTGRSFDEMYDRGCQEGYANSDICNDLIFAVLATGISMALGLPVRPTQGDEWILYRPEGDIATIWFARRRSRVQGGCDCSDEDVKRAVSQTIAVWNNVFRGDAKQVAHCSDRGSEMKAVDLRQSPSGRDSAQGCEERPVDNG
jgi:hypothetical protein